MGIAHGELNTHEEDEGHTKRNTFYSNFSHEDAYRNYQRKEETSLHGGVIDEEGVYPVHIFFVLLSFYFLVFLAIECRTQRLCKVTDKKRDTDQ